MFPKSYQTMTNIIIDYLSVSELIKLRKTSKKLHDETLHYHVEIEPI